MAPRLVNTAPGESTDSIKPGQFAQFGLKSELLKVPLASTHINMGLTNVVYHSVLPEDDTALAGIEAEVTLETSERRRPVDGTTPRAISGGNLVFTKSNILDGELGIYEVKMPINPRASCLASFRFKTKTAWTPFSADWCALSNMVGPYFGLEHGTFNTAAYAFLRANTVSGSLIVGGPLQSYNTGRPGQVEVVAGAPHASTPGFSWRSLPNNSVVEIYIFFNVEGYQTAPIAGVPTNVPLVEIWTKVPANTSPVVQAYIPVSSFGTFPSSLASPPFTNSRLGVSETATVFFGNIAQTGGSDILELEDWAFFPDFRMAVRDGLVRPSHTFIAYPDAPVEFQARENVVPFDLVPGRWFPEIGAGWLDADPELYFQPGRRRQATHLSLPKTETGLVAIHKTEPRFEELQDGIMVEAFISGTSPSPDGDGTGLGFSVDDGDKLYQVMAVGNTLRRYWGLAKDLSALDSATNGYHSPATNADFTSPKMVRLLIDRLRPVSIGGGKAQIQVDEEVVLTTDLSSDTFPASSSATGIIRVGHLGLPNALSETKVSILNYLPRYLAWEGVDALLPDDVGVNARVRFSTDINGFGNHVMVNDDVTIEKTSLGGTSRYLLSKAQSIAEVDGLLVDFQVKVDSYTDFGGNTFAVNSQTGVSLTVFLGNKKVEVGFYDCGIHGRKVAILPSSTLASDVIEQTEVGKALSASVDWTEMTQYRLIVKGHDRIELIVGSPINTPAISLSWRNETDGFDLPVDGTAPSIVFGHSDGTTTSISKWRFVRWGLSNGFEVAVQQKYPDGYPKYLFGGRALIKSEFDEA